MGKTLVLGLGNVLLSDDGAGVHVLRHLDGLDAGRSYGTELLRRDGGTLGLTLLTEFEHLDALIAIDAMELDATPGAVRAFIGSDMDRQLATRRTSVHQLALADLISAARLLDCLPARRALVGIQPGSLEWGTVPSPAVDAAIPAACGAVHGLLQEWAHEHAGH